MAKKQKNILYRMIWKHYENHHHPNHARIMKQQNIHAEMTMTLKYTYNSIDHSIYIIAEQNVTTWNRGLRLSYSIPTRHVNRLHARAIQIIHARTVMFLEFPCLPKRGEHWCNVRVSVDSVCGC